MAAALLTALLAVFGCAVATGLDARGQVEPHDGRDLWVWRSGHFYLKNVGSVELTLAPNSKDAPNPSSYQITFDEGVPKSIPPGTVASIYYSVECKANNYDFDDQFNLIYEAGSLPPIHINGKVVDPDKSIYRTVHVTREDTDDYTFSGLFVCMNDNGGNINTGTLEIGYPTPPTPAPTPAAPTPAAPTPAAPATAAPTTAAPTTAAPTTAAPTSSTNCCRALQPQVTDLWCQQVKCAPAFKVQCGGCRLR
jgi:hypothetical protein